MGCFSKKKAPQYTPPAPVKLPTADELMQSAISTAKAQQPLGYGARESGLADLAKGTSFYEGFQPTSLEQALSNQYFQNIMPDIEKSIGHRLSLAGMESSPIAARLIGRERGNLGFNVGSYLSNLGNERARYSLSSRMGIDPWSITNPLLEAGLMRSNQQGSLDQSYNEQVAMANYMNEMEKYKQKGAAGSLFGTIGGGALSLAAAPFTGGASLAYLPLAASAGGTLGGLFSGGQGGQEPIDLATALMLQGGNYPSLFPRQGYGRNTPRGTMNMGDYSLLPSTTSPVWGEPGHGNQWPMFAQRRPDIFGLQY